MKRLELSGSMVALVTPFTANGIDGKALKRLVEFHVKNGTSAIVPCGTTGESPTLSPEEHKKVVDIVVQTAAGRVPVIAGTGHNSLRETLEYTASAEKSGADGVLVVTPYYNRPTQNGLYRYYDDVSQSTPLPIILYSIRSRTGVNLEPSTVVRLVETCDNIVGIKEASGDLNQMSEIVHRTGNKIKLISGDDSLTLPVLSIGGVGVISVVANIMPGPVQSMITQFRAGNVIGARVLHYFMLDLVKAMFLETNPVPIKTAMGELGMIDSRVRSPLCSMERDNRAKLVRAMRPYFEGMCVDL